MNRGTIDRLADWAMLLIERLAFPLALLPLAIGYFRTGRWPATAYSLAFDITAGIILLAVGLLLGYARRKTMRLNRLRQTLNEAITHDLRNPMTSIIGCLSCALEGGTGKAERKTLLELGLHCCQEQMALIDSLVDTSRLEHGELAVQQRTIKTRELIGQCLQGARGLASHLRVALMEVHDGSFGAQFQGDPELLPRIILNLTHNALKYTPQGGTVTLKTHLDDTGMVIAVSDTGIGIPQRFQDRLFDKYYRVEGTHHAARRGSGLGLYFSRLVVEAHGGKIGIDSAAGKGTTVSFNIPQTNGRAADGLQR